MNRWQFLIPDRYGHPSGGTRYNAALIQELQAAGVSLGASEPDEVEAFEDVAWVWIDSLYLPAVPRIARQAREHGARRVGLIVHYVPSLVRGAGRAATLLSDEESRALAACDALLVTSEYMRAELARAGHGRKPCVVAEPGCELALEPAAPPTGILRALMVAHVTPGKGIFEFLQALAGEVSKGDEFELELAGAVDVDAPYFRRCRAFIEATPVLEGRVTFLGVLSEAALRDKYASFNLLLSASCMESYGMAVAEARTMGMPVLAIAAGNVAVLVDARAGGRLCADIDELAACFVSLARSGPQREALVAAARARALPPRAWARVAEEFLAAVRVIESLARE